MLDHWRLLRNCTARLCLVGALGSLCLSGLSHAEVLVVFGDDNYPPVIYAKNGQATGVLADILRKVSARSGDTYDLQLFPWKRAYEQARLGNGAVVGISMTAERRAIFDFSEPLYNDDIQIVMLKEHPFPFSQLSDLKGKTLGGVLGASYGDVVDRAIHDGLFTVDHDIGQTGRLRKLLARRIDAALIGNGNAGYETVLQSDPELQAQRSRLIVVKPPLAHDPLYLAVAKRMNKSAVIKRFNTALRELQVAGEFRQP